MDTHSVVAVNSPRPAMCESLRQTSKSASRRSIWDSFLAEGGTQCLPRLVGEGHTMRLILSGELIHAEEAADIGLVDEVYNESELDDSVYEPGHRCYQNR